MPLAANRFRHDPGRDLAAADNVGRIIFPATVSTRLTVFVVGLALAFIDRRARTTALIG